MRRRGISLLEVLAVITIIFVLFALLIPATSSSREAARRAQCVNNLKQLALGVQNYHDANDALPPTSSALGGDFSMKFRLLPYMEPSSTYNALNWSWPHDTPVNFTIRTTQMTWFLCPSDRNVPCGTATLGATTLQIGYHSYPNNIGTYLNNNGGKFDGPAYELGGGVRGEPVTLKMVTDGASNTIIFSEWIRGKNDMSPGTHAIYRSTDDDTGPVPLITLLNNCGVKPGVVSGAKGSDWLDPRCGKGGGYSHIMTPNLADCFFSNADFTKESTMIGASSYHPGGANAAFLDGSVRFMKGSINKPVWWGLGTKAGGEILSADSY